MYARKVLAMVLDGGLTVKVVSNAQYDTHDRIVIYEPICVVGCFTLSSFNDDTKRGQGKGPSMTVSQDWASEVHFVEVFI